MLASIALNAQQPYATAPMEAQRRQLEQPTPLERLRFTRLPKNREIVAFLRVLDGQSPDLSFVPLGRSAKGREVAAVMAARDGMRDGSVRKRDLRLRVLIVGSQHGRETSGAEALQMILRDLSEGRLARLLRRLELLIVPCANPDGRDLERQSNGNRVNLNSDYGLLSQPESRAIAGAISRFRPHLLLDVHESAILKRRTLGREGFLTDFEAQFDPACHPAIDRRVCDLNLRHLLPKILSAVEAKGLPAQRYVGELSSIHATISHGNLALRKLRNYAGLQGVLAMVLENRLDRSDETFPTPRNIAIRRRKQYLSIVTFLESCAAETKRIIEVVESAREKLASAPSAYRLPVAFDYALDPRKPRITLSYRHLQTDRRVRKTHRYHGRVAVKRRIALPRAFAITRHQKKLANLLDYHGIRHAVLNRVQLVQVKDLEVAPALNGSLEKQSKKEGALSIIEHTARVELSPGDLWIDLDQPMGRIAALILDPRSQDSIFQLQPYHDLLLERETSFVVPVMKEL